MQLGEIESPLHQFLEQVTMAGLQTGKREVGLSNLAPIGNYAVQPSFSDGHDTGIFSWDYLYFLGSQQEKLWADYNARLQAAGVSRDAPMIDKSSHACASH